MSPVDFPTEDPVPLDVTGTWDLQQQVDEITALVEREQALDGGLSWDTDARAVVVRLVGPVDEASGSVGQLKASVLAAAGDLSVEFRSVRYSRVELQQLADDLFYDPDLRGISGGWNAFANQVEVMVRLDSDNSQYLLDRLRALEDDRIQIVPFTPTPYDWGRRRRTRPAADPALATGSVVVPGLSVQRLIAIEAMQAQLIGALEVDASTNCLMFRAGSMLLEVAWPWGWRAELRSGEIALVDERGETVCWVGEEISIGGGFVDAATADIVSCAGHSRVFIASGAVRVDEV
ncbi:hypothetical protein OHA70_23515 [Kribbella sp. NBC_00382]|uniref:hypothetical protein n=1 Tax=Kribbella sp. NBC_00382 TaxID=2975967 RepID=UPI002E1DEC16